MVWEIIQRKNNMCLWQSKDAEGKKVFDVTGDRDGVAVEPSGCNYLYSIGAARLLLNK